jgi:glycosyltransferase involved in cell wall biosynthesis
MVACGTGDAVKTGRRLGFIAQGGAGWMGGSEYIRNLLRALAAAGAPDATLFCFADAANEWKDTTSQIAPVSPMWNAPLVDRLGLNNRHFAASLRAHPVDFLYPLTYGNRENIGLTFPLKRTLRNTAWAGWVPDFQHRHLPRFFTPAHSAFRDRGIAQLLAEAPAAVMSSETAANDLRTFHPDYAGRVEVLRFSTSPRPEWYEPFAGADLAQVPERFFAVCNQFWLHKNHLTVFRALALLADRNIRPIVICTGAIDDARDPGYPGQVRAALQERGIADQVKLLGLLPRRAQIELLRRSIAVIQPSLFEGWSTVVEDARVLGCRLLLSDIPVHREQDPPGARYFSPESPEALADLMASAWADWPAGPDPEAERVARSTAERRLVEVGKRFLEIATAS